MLAAIRDGVVVLRSNGQIAAVNQAMCEMTGFRREELVGALPPLPYWPPEQQSHIRFVRAATADGREGEFDMTFSCKNGGRFPAIVAIGVSREYDSRIVVIKDVTERELLNAQLQDAKQDAEAARLAFARSAEVIGGFLYSAEVLPDGSFVMHAQGPGNAELLGSDPADPDAPTTRRLHPDDRQAFAHAWSYETVRQADGAIVDIDHFKRIDDEHGNRIGDSVLREVAQRLRYATRSSDVISRWGGEEFCVLLGAIHDDNDMELRAERLRTAVTSAPIEISEGDPITATVSVGVARARRARAERRGRAAPIGSSGAGHRSRPGAGGGGPACDLEPAPRTLR